MGSLWFGPRGNPPSLGQDPSNGSETKRVCQLPAPVFSFNFNWKTSTTLLSFGVFCLSVWQGKLVTLLVAPKLTLATHTHIQRRLSNFYFLIFRVITAGGDTDWLPASWASVNLQKSTFHFWWTWKAHPVKKKSKVPAITGMGITNRFLPEKRENRKQIVSDSGLCTSSNWKSFFFRWVRSGWQPEGCAAAWLSTWRKNRYRTTSSLLKLIYSFESSYNTSEVKW